MRYKLAIFDLDGTILDTLEDLKNSVNYALERHGYPTRTLDEARRFVGNGVRKLMERAAPACLSPEELDALYGAFRAHYQAHSMDTTRPYEGIEALLPRLRAAGLRLAVVSNKIDPAVKELCERFFPGQFELTVGETPGVAKKPAPDMVDQVLERLEISREDAVYIGDSEVDIQTARNAEMDGCVVSWGFRDPAFLREQGAGRIVADADELYAALTA